MAVRRRFRAILNSTDVSTAAEVIVYVDGDTVYTVLSTDVLQYETIQVIVGAPDADIHLFASAASSPGAGGTISRGDFTNSADIAGMIQAFNERGTWEGAAGWKPWITTNNAVAVDVVLTGVIVGS